MTAAGTDMTLEALNAKRNEINTLIKEIIEKSDDKKGDRQIRKSFDCLKKKLSEVLATLKNQLDERTKQKVDEAVKSQTIDHAKTHASIQL